MNPNPSPGTRFRPGQTGNPQGRPKTKLVTEALLKELAKRAAKGGPTQAQEGARVIVEQWLAGDMTAAKLAIAYVDGLPAQPVEHQGADGGPLEIVVKRVEARSDAGDRAD